MIDITNPQLPTLLTLNISLNPYINMPLQQRREEYT